MSDTNCWIHGTDACDCERPAAPQSDQPAQERATLQEVLRRHIQSQKSTLEMYERTGNEVGALFERGMIAGIKRAIEVADNMEAHTAAPASQPVAPSENDYLHPSNFVDDSRVFKPATPSSGADARELADGLLKPFVRMDPHYGWEWQSTPSPVSLRNAIAALLESFRAEMLEQMESFVENAMADEHYAKIRPEQIRNFQSDPNWLARQIAEAREDEANWWVPLVPYGVSNVIEKQREDRLAQIVAIKSALAPKEGK